MLDYFAHNGVDHVSEAEATAHRNSSAMVTVAVTLVILLGIVLAVRTMDKRAARRQRTQESTHEQ